MFAVVEISGFQYEVTKSSVIDIPFMEGNPGDTFSIDKILLGGTDAKTKFGEPYLKGTVDAKILEHFRGDKQLVFKKKRRKGYRKLNGHRQDYTKVEITNIKL